MSLIVVATPPTILTGGTLLIAFMNRRSQKEQHEENAAALNSIHLEINGRMTELLRLTRQASRAEGVKAEKENPE
jgi:hypothetical protein